MALGATMCLALVLASGAAAAFEARFEMDRRQDLPELARTGRVAISVDRIEGRYVLDASAVLRVDPRRLLEVSVDFDRYVELGVPHLRESHTVAVTRGGDLRYVWSSMSALGQSSRHYLAVEVLRQLAAPEAVGLQWALTPRQAGWQYEPAPAFARLDGSWYLEPLSPDTLYVRYFLAATLDPAVPDRVVSWLVKRQLRDGTCGVIRALAHEAATRPR